MNFFLGPLQESGLLTSYFAKLTHYVLTSCLNFEFSFSLVNCLTQAREL